MPYPYEHFTTRELLASMTADRQIVKSLRDDAMPTLSLHYWEAHLKDLCAEDRRRVEGIFHEIAPLPWRTTD